MSLLADKEHFHIVYKMYIFTALQYFGHFKYHHSFD